MTKTNTWSGPGLLAALALTLLLTPGAAWGIDIDGGATVTVPPAYTPDAALNIGIFSTGTLDQTGLDVFTDAINLGTTATGSGLYILSDGTIRDQTGLLPVPDEVIGVLGSGNFFQIGGDHAVTTLTLGQNPGSNGNYFLFGGALTAVNETIGKSGAGAFTQSGGYNYLTGSLYLGQADGSTGSYDLSDGILAADFEVIGVNGTGAFTQSGGYNYLTSVLILGYITGNGTYNLSSGTLDAQDEIVGWDGNGTFTQSGGTNTLTGLLVLGVSAGSSGAYTLSGGVLTAVEQYIGLEGTGVFTQSGGTNTVTYLSLGGEAGGSGTYNLQGGSLYLGAVGMAGAIDVNATGLSTTTGVFNQTGGNLLNVDPLFPFNFNNQGTFTYSGGVFEGRLKNLTVELDVNGVVNFNADFTAGAGLQHTSLIPLTINAGRTITLNGPGGDAGQPDNLDNQATIIVDGTLAAGAGAGPLVNNTTGLLVGTGTIQGALVNQGTVDPGDYLPSTYVGPLNPRPQNQQAGVLNVTGSFIQTATGTLVVDVLSTAVYDQLNVAGAPGTASLAGTMAPTLRGGFIPAWNQVFPSVISAPGGLTGTFATVANQQITPIKFWQPVYYPTHVDLRVGANFTTVSCLNPNTLQVGVMLNNLAPGVPMTSDLYSVLNTLANLPTCSRVAEAYSQLTPAKAAVLPNLAFAGAKLQRQTLSERLTGLRFGLEGGQLGGRIGLSYNGLQGLMLASSGAIASDVSSPVTGSRYLPIQGQWAVYSDFNMVLGNFTGNAGFAGCNYTIPGFTLGADYRLQDNLIVGVATGYQYTNADFTDSGGNLTGNTWPLTVYAAWFPNQAYVYGSLGYALNLYDLDRNISFGDLNRRASGSTIGNQFNLYAEAGYDFNTQPFVITPLVNLAYSQLSVGSFTEKGAGALNLKVGSQSVDSLQTGFGARMAMEFKINQIKIVPQVYTLFVHEFGNANRNLNASLAQTAGSGFTFRTSEPGRDFEVLGGTLTASLSQNLSLNFNYNAEVGRNNSTANFLNASLRYAF